MPQMPTLFDSLDDAPPRNGARLRVAQLGPAADAALATAIVAAKSGDPLAPVTVAVPTTLAGLSLRRRLAHEPLGAAGPGLVNVRFLVLARVAELLGAPRLAAQRRQPLNHAVRLEMVRAILRANPGRLEAVLHHPDSVAAVDATLRDLRRTPPQARRTLRSLGANAAHAIELYDALRNATASDWYDDDDLAEAAAAAVRDADGVLADVGTVLLHLPRRLTPAQLDLAAALASAERLYAVVGVTGDEVADESATANIAALTPLLGLPDTPSASARPHATALVRAVDPDDEVRTAIRGVLACLEAGVALHDLAIVWRATDPYATLVHEQLSAAQVPFSGPGARTLAQTLAGRTLLGLLALPDCDFRRADVFAWLTGAPVLLRERGRTLVPSTRFEELARDAGILEGAASWAARLGVLDARKESEIRQLEEEPDEHAEWRLRRLERDRRAIAELQNFMADLIARATPPARTGWRDFARWARGLLTRYLGVPGADWPDAEVDALHLISTRVAALAALDQIGPADTTVFRHAVEQELSVPAHRAGAFGDGVFTGRLGDAAGMVFHTIFVLGLADGAFPPPVTGDPLLPDRLRRRAGETVPLRAERRSDERRDWLAALASAAARVVSVPHADPRAQRARLPARWFLDEASHLAGVPCGASDLDDLGPVEWFHDIPSFEAGLRSPRAHISTHDRDLRELLAVHHTGSIRAVQLHPLVASDPRAMAGFDAQAARRSPHVNRWNGRAGADARAVRDEWSPSRLQAMARCPYQFFLASVLRIAEPAEPEPVEVIAAGDRGHLIHRCLERFVAEHLEHPPAPDARWSASDHARLREIAQEEFARAQSEGLTGRPLLWRLEQERILADLERTLRNDDTNRAAGNFVPVGVEVEFGGADAPVAVALTGGSTIRFRGRIDRVDRGSDRDGGEILRVVDYKSGKTDDYKAIRKDPVARGTQMQLPVYALGAQARYGRIPVRADFWFVTDRGDFDVIGYDVGAEQLDRFRSTLDVLSGLMASGTFPARPGAATWDSHVNCRYCAYSRLCPPDRARRWEQVRDDPAIAAYLDLAEGVDAPDGDNGGGNGAENS